MRHVEKLAPVGALTAALISITCCLPFSIPAALGLAGLSMFASQNQLWLIAASLILLLAGVLQLFRKRACQRRSRTSTVLLCVSAVLVFAVTFLPETIAGFLADHRIICLKVMELNLRHRKLAVSFSRSYCLAAPSVGTPSRIQAPRML